MGVYLQVLGAHFPSLGHETVIQETPRGFWEAIGIGLNSLPDSTADVLVVPGNLPLLTSQSLAVLVQHGQKAVLDRQKGLTHLTSGKDAGSDSGVFWASAAFLQEALTHAINGESLRLAQT